MRKVIAGLLTMLSVASAVAHQGHHHADTVSRENEAPIKITINPEVRVSVERVGPLPPPVQCGEAMALPVSIVNQGFLTAPLQVSLVELSPDNVRLDFSGESLKGLPEQRTLYVILTEPGPTDITVAFRAKGDVGDLGGRDRIHLLVSCEASMAGVGAG